MKRFKYGVLAAALVAGSVIAPVANADAASVKGSWKHNAKGYWYEFEDGSYAKKEFINGWWLNKAGWWSDKTKYEWHEDSNGWWFGKSKVWYAQNSWQKINGVEYFFHSDGYMATDEYIKGFYVDKDGAYVEKDYRAGWRKSADGKWWYKTGLAASDYLKDTWQKIDGYYYHFDADGWLDTWKVIKSDDGPHMLFNYYGFGSTGRIGNTTMFEYAETLSGSVTFSFDESSDREAAAEDMDLFLTLSLEEGTSKKVKVNGVDKYLAVTAQGVTIANEGEPTQTLIEYVKNSVSEKVTVEGVGTLSKLFEAFDAAGLVGGNSYNYYMEFGNEEKSFKVSKFGMSDAYINVTVDGKNYQALYDGVVDGQPTVVFLGDRTEDLGMSLADAGIVTSAEVMNGLTEEITSVEY